ncbi:hypothetical protein [Streptomyces sp. NPDC048669]|uniref:hypothetical protein n=1 Tax=Streptomyces sp. NPDC048669 TaxID=3155267 RepID=UPI003431EFE2
MKKLFVAGAGAALAGTSIGLIVMTLMVKSPSSCTSPVQYFPMVYGCAMLGIGILLILVAILSADRT